MAHIVPRRVYYLVFATLLLLTLVTVDVAFFNLGVLSLPVALLIATCKALLVIFYFMHVRYSPRLTWVFAGAGFFWLLILIGLTMSDFLTRAWLSPAEPPQIEGPQPAPSSPQPANEPRPSAPQ